MNKQQLTDAADIDVERHWNYVLSDGSLSSEGSHFLESEGLNLISDSEWRARAFERFGIVDLLGDDSYGLTAGCKEFNKLIFIRSMIWLHLNGLVDNNIKHKIVNEYFYDNNILIDNIKHFVHNHMHQTIRDKKL